MTEPMFNVDRWIAYTRQRNVVSGNHAKTSIFSNGGQLCDMTPKQIKRCKKKMHKNNDQSIGIF